MGKKSGHQVEALDQVTAAMRKALAEHPPGSVEAADAVRRLLVEQAQTGKGQR